MEDHAEKAGLAFVTNISKYASNQLPAISRTHVSNREQCDDHVILLTLWSVLLGVRKTAMGVVANAAGVAGTVTFTSRFNPDDRIDQARAGVRGRARAEAGVVDIAPITPG